jgi:DNA-binding NarL/FixJ family response regulator
MGELCLKIYRDLKIILLVSVVKLRLTPEDVCEISKLHEAGMSVKDISNKLGFTKTTIKKYIETFKFNGHPEGE